MPEVSLYGYLKQILIGRPIPSHLSHRERFGVPTGLAVLSSDCLSSVAYATEEILRTVLLAGAGIGALWVGTPISMAIAGLMIVIVISYSQTIRAYPGGGGSYIVARENLSTGAGLVAGAALLTDYVMTVAVSIAAGVAAVTSAFPEWREERVLLALGFLLLLIVGNLRGVRESGLIFSAPTYYFVLCMLVLIAAGFFKVLAGTAVPLPFDPENTLAAGAGAGGLTLFLVLRAFSNGCTALTGIEAVSNGVPAFKPPESRRAVTALSIMAALAVTMFLGIAGLAHAFAIIPGETETVTSQLARAAFGGRGILYFAVQAATTLILVLAANTAFADFPRLASILARDRFLPRQFMNQGDRLAFSNGILLLGGLSGALLVAFKGDTHALIPLYMIGVFLSFTLSQSGMVLKWHRERGAHWKSKLAVNAGGAALSGIVSVVVAVTKFHEGAWISLALIPVIVMHFRWVFRHYQGVARQLDLAGYQSRESTKHIVLVPIGGIHRAVVQAMDYARGLGDDLRAVYVEQDPGAADKIKLEWKRWGAGTPLVVLSSPFRSLLEPLLEYVEQVQANHQEGYLTIVVPEFVPARWYHHLLHNQQALLIKMAFLFRSDVVVTSVPFRLR